jgi:uncharacterized protein YjdB
MPQKVRDIMGLDNDAVLNDRQIEEHIRVSQEKVKEQLFIYHHLETIDNSRAGDTWDGSNKTFNTTYYPIMDSNYDFTVDNNDITCVWLNSSYNPQTSTVTVSNATLGIITITQSDGSTAIPSDADDVMVTYYSCNRNISKKHLENLTTLWAAHLVLHSMKSPTSISMADYDKNEKILLSNPDQFKDEYQRYINQLLSGRTVRGV